jgi:hypothetical protein
MSIYFLYVHLERLAETMKATDRIVVTRPKFEPSIYPTQYYRCTDIESSYDLLLSQKAQWESCNDMCMQQNKFRVENLKMTEIISMQCRQIQH